MTVLNARNFRASDYSFTRPGDTTAYSAGDLAANDTTGTSVVPLSWDVTTGKGRPFFIPRIRLRKSASSVTNAQFRVHLFSATPTLTGGAGTGDNSAFATSVTTGIASWIGSFDGTMVAHTADGAAVDCLPTQAVRRQDYISGGTLYGLIEVLAAYTPANAEVFTATLVMEFIL